MEIKTNGFKLPSGDIHVFIPPEPTETDRGGIKASEKTTESLEVKYDKKTGKLFSPTSPTDNTLTKSNVAADAKKTGDEFARVNNNMESKLDKQQGVENKGKALVVGEDGNVVVGEVQSSGNTDIIKALQDALISKVVNGESINVSDSSRLPVEEFLMSGKTVQNGTPTPTNPVDIEVTPQGIITVDFTDGTNHQIVELNCPREFTKWDRIEKIDGTWNWIFQSNKKIINEKTGFNTNTPQQQGQDGIVFTTSFPDASGGNQTSLCDKFKNLNYVYGGSYKEKYGYYCDHVSVEQKYFRPPNETIQTLEQWKTWLTENPIEILYKTKVPELIPLSLSEQNKLNALTMYAPNTEITNTGGCNMELTYTVDTKAYVDAKIASVVKSVVETQKALL